MPELLAGGQGLAWRVGDLVLKPVTDPAEHAWVSEVYAGWDEPSVAVPEPVAGREGSWTVAGWGAHRWVPGRPVAVVGDPVWFRKSAEAFHRAVAGLPRPDLLDARQDPWTQGDRVAWEGAPPTGAVAAADLVVAVRGLLEPARLACQVVHGDLTGNLLATPDGRPLVIDWPPYFRPVAWSLAVVVTDAWCWQRAGIDLVRAWGDLPAWEQMLLRALAYRVTTRGILEPGLVADDLKAERALVDLLAGGGGGGR